MPTILILEFGACDVIEVVESRNAHHVTASKHGSRRCNGLWIQIIVLILLHKARIEF